MVCSYHRYNLDDITKFSTQHSELSEKKSISQIGNRTHLRDAAFRTRFSAVQFKRQLRNPGGHSTTIFKILFFRLPDGDRTVMITFRVALNNHAVN